MMISPEEFYELHLKDKSSQEILKEIKSLKHEINELKRQIEDPTIEFGDLVLPSRLTRIKCSREYLDLAIEAYQNTGEEYKCTKAEQKSHKFDQQLESLSRMAFTIGGFFGGYETRTYTVAGGKILFDLQHTIYAKPTNLPLSYPFTKEEFIDGIKELHIGEWKKNTIIQMCLMVHNGYLSFILKGARNQSVLRGAMLSHTTLMT